MLSSWASMLDIEVNLSIGFLLENFKAIFLEHVMMGDKLKVITNNLSYDENEHIKTI